MSMEVLQMFLFLYKSKYRRKTYWLIPLTILFHLTLIDSKCVDDCNGNGRCMNDTCVCNDGWQGPRCEYCGGKVQLAIPPNGTTIHDGFGNYSIGVKCSWLITAPNHSITLHMNEFATECGWDHLYVYDGDSVESPLLAVLSGLMYAGDYAVRRVPEITATSGSALVHFFSDDAYNMSGFNLTYRLDACPSRLSTVECSGHGVCVEGACTCDGGWTGAACDRPKCPNRCGGHGRCQPEVGCECDRGYKGDDCTQAENEGYWERVVVESYIPPGVASHGAEVWHDSMYILGGESYTLIHDTAVVYTYDFNGNIWETLRPFAGPTTRYAHSTVIYGDKIFLYGGVVGHRDGGAVGELWAFDVSAKTWENITVKAESCNGSYLMCGPLKCAGHTATVVLNPLNKKADRMVVIFGHSPQLGYLNTVQEYYFGTREWHIVATRGYPIKGGYGHSAAYDPLTALIYVYGGIISESESTQTLANGLYAYEPNTRVWTRLNDAPSARFLHTATFLTGLMLVFGGNTHSDTAHSYGAKCYSAEMLAYDTVCDTWHRLDVPNTLNADLARFGHSAVVFERSLYIYGGFDGQMLNDLLRYKPGTCVHYRTASECLNSRPGVKCIWNTETTACLELTRNLYMQWNQNALRNVSMAWHGQESILQMCPELNRTSITLQIIQNSERCVRFVDCHSCLHARSDCVWCGGDTCTFHQKCRNVTERTIMDPTQCPTDPGAACRQSHTCSACTSLPACLWRFDHGRCVALAPHAVATSTTSSNVTLEAAEPMHCPKACVEYNSCLNCTQEECIWCQNEGRCVDKNAYTASFPYGQCREWTTVSTKCRTGKDEVSSQCGFYATCTQCRDDPACGWCDDGSKTGLGQCMRGGYAGPTLHLSSLPSSTCPSERWHFTTCPACQCNGHAHCVEEGNGANRNATLKCGPCADLTTGAHCERCQTGYWGNPVNGGRCQPCDCNRQATHCHSETGKCYCTTKGLIGDHCEKCDVTNHYNSDPINKDSCYYDLTIDYQFTFNLSKKEDRHYTQINFRNSPIKADVDADFSITCSVMAKMNITIRRGNSKEEKPIHEQYNCTTFRSRFVKSEYNFGVQDNVTLTTFYVYVYDFQPPLWIQISFSQYPKLNLQQFFITFSSCFLLLLLVAAILWKIKQRYDLFRRRQRLFVEMAQMASRPFSQVLVEIESKTRSMLELWMTGRTRRCSEIAPSPIALEPCAGNRAAVLSLLVRLPTGGATYTVKGQNAGLAIASALVTLGNPRKVSVDGGKIEAKKGGRQQGKQQSQHPDSCA